MDVKNYHQEYDEIIALIAKSHNILIVPHIDPDQDALGSGTALILALSRRNYQCKLGLQDDNHEQFNYVLPEKSYIIYSEKEDPGFDLIITVDIGSQERMGKYHQLLNSDVPVINLDHHIDNDNFGDINIADIHYSSTSELVYEFLGYHNFTITDKMAYCLYTGIVFDTGSFRYSLTSSKTHVIASELLKYNIDTNAVYERLFENLSESALKLRNIVTSTLELYCNRELAFTFIRLSFYDECGADESDGSTLVKIGASLQGVQVSIFLKEKKDRLIKVSLRSKGDFKVNEIAKKFGGGGHEKAAGFIIEDNFQHAKDIITSKVIPLYSDYLAKKT